ncbi:MAG: Hpt domain-containing protein [Giesbergeria sp.]|nr:Hpt domain-containing protein [Giesbergeria sp.]
MAQFVKDLDDGDAAIRGGDLQALRRVAHNLKSALTLLGQKQAALAARATEEHAAQSALEAAHADWAQLCPQIRAFMAQGTQSVPHG